MCVGGPPKPMQPIRPHSRTIVGSPGDGFGHYFIGRFCTNS